MQVKVVERAQEIQVQEQEILRKEKELEATVRRPAEAEKYRLEKLAEANRLELISCIILHIMELLFYYLFFTFALFKNIFFNWFLLFKMKSSNMIVIQGKKIIETILIKQSIKHNVLDFWYGLKKCT